MKNKYKTLMRILPLIAILFSSVAFAQEGNDEKTTYFRPDLGTTTQKDVVVAVDKIQGESLKSYPDINLSNSLQGKAAGLIIRMTNNGLGNNVANIYIRGLSTNGDSKAIVIIDGIERPIDDLIAEEIESIDVLKDASAKILYGPSAANGVLVVKTKRGFVGKRVMKLTAEMGVMEMTRTPKYLNSYQYTSLYNEARVNDGLPERYMPYQLEGYKNSTGANDVLYPNVDWYDYFLKKQSVYRKATFEANGGNKKLKYSMVAGYIGTGGYEKVGTSPDLNRLTVRGNLDLEVTDFMSVIADVAGRMENRTWAAATNGEAFTALSGNRPNEFPLTIPATNLGLTPDDGGVPYFGGSTQQPRNLLADLQYRGNSQERYVTSQTNIGLDFNLNKFVKGLKASGYMTFDNYSYVSQELRKAYPIYGVRPYLDATGQQQVQYPLLTKLAPSDDNNITNDETRRTTGWKVDVSYKNSFDNHNFSAVAGYQFNKYEVKGIAQNDINCNYSLRLNYDYSKKYIVELSSAYMGSNTFAPANRFFLSTAAAAGWVISNEDFLAKSENVNFLKLKASYGTIGFSRNTADLLYSSTWNDGGTINLGEGNSNNGKVVSLVRVGNPNLKWEKSTELNVGVDGSFFKNKLQVEINYFNQKRSDIIGTMNSDYAGYVGPFTMATNIGSVQNQGIDGSVSWGTKTGDFEYRFGLNFTISKNVLLSWDESNLIEQDRKTVGKTTSAMFGMQSLGLFGRDVDINTAPIQKFGPYGVGDIAYKDRNGDGVVDARDEYMIGNSFPTGTFGIDVNLKYKNWGLYVLGTSELGVNKMLSNSYYWNVGDGKYSVLAEQRYHPINNPTGIYPILTSKAGQNSYRNSDFWIQDASFFRLKNIELSYNFNFKNSKSSAKAIKVFARGTNLFVISKIKDLDPEALDAGVTNYPISSIYSGGVSFTF